MRTDFGGPATGPDLRPGQRLAPPQLNGTLCSRIEGRVVGPRTDSVNVAQAARRLLQGEISFHEFLDTVPTETDSRIETLVDLITHEPQRGGALGVDERLWQEHRDRVLRLIQEIEEG